MNKKYVAVTGCFDIIHVGHLSMFHMIKDKFPDHELMIIVDSDERVKEMKGEGRPINKLQDRINILKSIKYVDRVISFYSDEGLEELMSIFKPIRFVGSDYKNKPIIGKEHSPFVVYYDRVSDYSTTNIIEKIKNG